MLSALELTLILLVAAVGMVVLLRMFNLPPLVAYLAVGALLGPHATGLAADAGAVHGFGEIGVVFLMFSLGLEFNLEKLSSMRRLVFGLGGLWSRPSCRPASCGLVSVRASGRSMSFPCFGSGIPRKTTAC